MRVHENRRERARHRAREAGHAAARELRGAMDDVLSSAQRQLQAVLEAANATLSSITAANATLISGPALNRTVMLIASELSLAKTAVDEALDTLLASPSAAQTVTTVDATLGPGSAHLILFSFTLLVALWVLLFLPCRLCCRGTASAKDSKPTKRGAAKASKSKSAQLPTTKGGNKGLVRVRMCRYCEVEVRREHEAAHLGGKRHQKLAGGVAASACFEWVQKRVADDDAAETDLAAAPALKSDADGADAGDDGWETVTAAAKKKDARAAATARRKAAAAAAEAAAVAQAPPRQLRVHRRCDECGIRARDGATIETDPDNENRAYCTECWDRWSHPPEEAPAAEPAPLRKHVTKWNRDS